MVTRQERLAALERQVERLTTRKQDLGSASQRYWLLKLQIFVGGVVAFILLVLVARWLGLLCALGAVVAFVVVARLHSKVDKSYVRHTVSLDFKQAQLARMRLDWESLPPPLEAEEVDHPFAIDLDITGERSLHRLMNTAVSFEGSERLGQWLLHPSPDLGAIRQRQAFVRELLPLTSFRNKLQVHSLHATRFTNSQYDESSLLDWLRETKQTTVPRSILYVPTLFCACTIALLLLSFLQLVPV